MSPLALDPWRERRCAGSMACERWPVATKALKREWRAASERPTAQMGIEEIEFVAASRNERSRHQFTVHGSMGQGL
jgi:hypothetical protein